MFIFVRNKADFEEIVRQIILKNLTMLQPKRNVKNFLDKF
jgi:hypothetical protein